MKIARSMASSVVYLAAGIVMYGAMRSTNPSREQHLQEVADVVERAVKRIYEEKILLPEESRVLADYLSEQVIPAAVEKLTSQRIDVTDYGLFSVGSVTLDEGDSSNVSLGVFGKVFTLSEDQAYEYLKKAVVDDKVMELIKQLNKE